MPTAVVIGISGTRGRPVSVSGLGILPQLVLAPAAYGGGVVAVRDRDARGPETVAMRCTQRDRSSLWVHTCGAPRSAGRVRPFFPSLTRTTGQTC